MTNDFKTNSIAAETPTTNSSDNESMNNSPSQPQTIQPPIIDIEGLNFEFFGKKILFDIDFQLVPGERCLLIGPNGAGKSTFLRVLAGLHLSFDNKKLLVTGTDRPNDQQNGLSYMGNRWVKQVSFTGSLPHMADIRAGDMMKDWQEENQARRDELIQLLGIDENWRMHQVSDGQRKKVQIMLALLRPFRLALIDEFVSELDVVVRNKLYVYLDREIRERNGAILYASHVFDNLELYFDNVICINNGRLGEKIPMKLFLDKYNSIPPTISNDKVNDIFKVLNDVNDVNESKYKTLKLVGPITPTPSLFNLFNAVYQKLTREESEIIEGRTKTEVALNVGVNTNSFKGSGYGSGRGMFM